MTATQLRRRVEFWQRTLAELGISHWRIEECVIVDETNGGANAAASVGHSQQYASMWLQFRRDFVEEAAPSKLDETIVHELLHVAFRDLDEAKDSGESWFTAAAWTDYSDRYTHESEGIIEGLARLIVRLHG